MRRPFVAGNWKMNGTRDGAKRLAAGVAEGVSTLDGVDVAVCPPYVFIPEVAQVLDGTVVALGAQDVAKEQQGAYTGEVSGGMLKEFACRYVIVGHSERREYYCEDDALVAEKFASAQRDGLVPILCVGEKLEDREAGRTEDVVRDQLEAVLERNGISAFANAVIAYEPVWAIGTGRTATPEQAQEVHRFIRELLSAADAGVAAGVRILYGGSVKAANAAELFAMPDIDGGLIGGASLDVAEFTAICRSAVV